MATNINYDIVGSFNKSYAMDFDPQDLLNCFVISDPEGFHGKIIHYTPGLEIKVELHEDKKGRKLYKFQDNLYWVSGKNLYRITEKLNAIFLGKLNTEIGYIGVADNNKQILFVDGNQQIISNKNTKIIRMCNM